MKKNKVTLMNIISNFILQFCNIISTLIIPKIILSYFGSEVNGLVSSINQFLGYISLVEGGITAVLIANLYKPLYDKDDTLLSSVIKTADRFYKKIGIIFIIYSLIIALIYPIIFKVNFSYLYVCSLTIILSLSLFIQYMFSATFKNLLNADKKVYIVSNVQILIVVLNIILAIISVKIFPSIHILKLISGLLYAFQPLIFNWYVKKNYNVDKKANVNNDLLKSRWDGFAINIAAFIHNSTDITILTIFSDLSMVSVYSVYALVTNGLKQIINAIASGINPTIGQAYVQNDLENLNRKMDLFEYIIFVLVFFVFSIAGLLITPFVMIYTKGINDANYFQPIFGILLVISEAIYILKLPHLNLAYNANKFKEITKPAFCEAILNIVISVILVKLFGIVGVAVGTIIAMLYRMIFHVWYTKQIIPNRNQLIFYKKLLIFSIATAIGICLCIIIAPIVKYNLLSWITHGIIYAFIIGIIYIIISFIFFKEEISFFKKYLKK